MVERFKLKPIVKITISALFVALTIVVSKFIPISNVFNLPFLRISFGPTLLIFAGILLGPFYGAMTGLLSDLIGFIFDTTGFAYNPLFSLTYLLYGLLPGLLIKLLKKNKTKFPYIQVAAFILINVFVISFFSMNDSISPFGGKVYTLDLTTKLIVILSTVGISILYFVIYFLISRKIKTDENKVILNNISIINFAVLIFVQLFIGIIVKLITYEVSLEVLIASQIIVTTIELLISNYLVSILYITSKKIFKVERITYNHIPQKKYIVIRKRKKD